MQTAQAFSHEMIHKHISWADPQTTLKRETQARMEKCKTPQARNEAESPWSMLTVRGK